MHIKRVIVDNFVSYEHLELPSDLSKGLNLILGQNGSGKSNFHQGRYIVRNMVLAIIFALSDAHSKKTKQERRQYLNVRLIIVDHNTDRTNAKARSIRLKSY
jgi:chromosome segregation ATPase